MKKFKFKQADLGEVLSREELKKIYGGSESAGTGSNGKYPKIEACKGKSYLDDCAFTSNTGRSLSGCCQYDALALKTTLYCSDLNVAPYTSCTEWKNSSKH